ncbi:hypothetical protein K1719_039009 [Acacia pycnantha]|nr:hypothetical protein K1719_039009 [Acacia pycnantha]
MRESSPVPAIVWDATVAKYAQNYANVHKVDCQLTPSNEEYGELLQTSVEDMSEADAMEECVAQKAYYDYNTDQHMRRWELLAIYSNGLEEHDPSWLC